MECLSPALIRTLVLTGILVACAPGTVIFGAEGDRTDPATEETEGPFGREVRSGSSTVELAPLVVSASRYEEDLLRAPASISVISSGALIGEGVPSVVASLRTVAGVDVQQAGINRYMVAVRGFNNAFASNTYVLVDHREAYNPALAVVGYAIQPIDALDLERVEVVR
jgi:outer membrane receptor protein involved in Fe transport